MPSRRHLDKKVLEIKEIQDYKLTDVRFLIMNADSRSTSPS